MAEVRLTILYNDTGLDPGLHSGAGFSCLVETPEATVLLDTGNNGAHLTGNFRRLGKNPGNIDTLVISHLQEGHVNGLSSLLQLCDDITLYLPEPAQPDAKALQQFHPEIPETPAQIEAGIFIPGILGTSPAEQCLVIQAAEGLLVVTGCAHGGISNLLDGVVSQFPYEEILLVLGGFHLRESDPGEIQSALDKLRTLQVRRIAPAHCTGAAATERFREAFGEEFIAAGTGLTLEYQARGLE